MTQQKYITLIGEKQMSTCWTQISMRQQCHITPDILVMLIFSPLWKFTVYAKHTMLHNTLLCAGIY